MPMKRTTKADNRSIMELGTAVSIRDPDEGWWHRLWFRLFPTGFVVEAKALVVIALPVVCTNVLQYLVVTISIIMSGHLSNEELAAVGLAASLINAFGICYGTGLSTACDTLFSQTYGSKYKLRMGMFLQRSFLVISIFPLFTWALYLNFEPLLIVLGQPVVVSEMTALYVIYFGPGILFQHYYLILARYMQNQDIVYPPLVCAIIGVIFNAVSQYVCLYVLTLGYLASAVCQAFTFFLMFIFELVYVVFSKLYLATWDGWKREAFCDWGQFLSLALPGMGMISLEVLCWEIGTFVSGILGAIPLAAQTVVYQIQGIAYMLAFGLGIAENIRVGQHVGAGRPLSAKTVPNVGIAITLAIYTVISACFLLFRNFIPLIFTSDSEVASLASTCIIVLAAILFPDSLNALLGGVLRGCGKQHIGAFFVLLAFYAIGTPTGIALAFATELGVVGVWLGVLIGVFVSVVGYIVVTYRMDWEAECIKAKRRIGGGNGGKMEPEDLDETAALLVDKPSVAHRRMLSNPGWTSTTAAPVDTTTSHVTRGQNFIYLLLKRALIYLFALCVFIGGILLNRYLPRELYYPHSPTNNSVLNNTMI